MCRCATAAGGGVRADAERRRCDRGKRLSGRMHVHPDEDGALPQPAERAADARRHEDNVSTNPRPIIASINSSLITDCCKRCHNAISDLRNNHIRKIDRNSFAGLVNVHSVFLNSNQLSYIESDTFAELSSLRYLYLNENRISKLAENAFGGLAQLQTL